MIGKKGVDVNKLKRDLDAVRKSASEPFYKSANAAEMPVTPELQGLLQRMPNEVVNYGKRIFQVEGLKVPPIPGKVGTIAAKDFRIYDLVKRGLDEAIEKEQNPLTGQFSSYGKSLIDLKTQYLGYLDKANPDYGKARALWAGPTRSTRMIDKGRKVFSMDPTNVGFEISKLTPEDKQYFQLGAAQAVKEALSGKRDMLDKATAIFATPKSRELLRPIFPSEDAFRVFANRMETERAMSGTRGYMLPTAGSKTAGLTTDIGEFGGKAETGALSKLITGDIGGAALQLAPGVYGKTTGMTPPVATSLQKSLLTPGVKGKDFADEVRRAREAAERGERMRQGVTKALTVPYAIPGATEQR